MKRAIVLVVGLLGIGASACIFGPGGSCPPPEAIELESGSYSADDVQPIGGYAVDPDSFVALIDAETGLMTVTFTSEGRAIEQQYQIARTSTGP